MDWVQHFAVFDTAHFGDGQTCRFQFKEVRDKQGVICKKCGHCEHYWKRDKECYECKSCRFRTSLRGGTIMENSNLSFLIWYGAVFLMGTAKKGFFAKEMQRQLGLKRHEPVWAMVHKLRKAMGNWDARHTLEGMVEMDEGYFTVAPSDIERPKGKRGRAAAGKRNVALMAESIPFEDIDTGKKSRQARYFKAKVPDTHRSTENDRTVQGPPDERTIVFSGQITLYVDISDFIELHITEKSTKELTTETLKWVHLFISNAKGNLLGNYPMIKGNYLQLYWNEFVYKPSRRYFGERLFDRMAIAAITGA